MGPDPNFSKIRAADLHPEAVVSQQIRDGLAKIDESTSNKGLKLIGMLLGLVGSAAAGIIELEKQIIVLREEVRQLRDGR
ncbi:hypothetical protein BST11_15335 [Mycobacterium alsense]|nr:hypothetical protein BST11_15335 [Mycobacterium alsense]